ncbi:uncharacterized protein G2W53_019081 [Senna tora]|uniref:Uncharacterized protein n=1 Tax=Senna tora TaxID=362788 RepID=A0A834WLZ7_9FABA|nr:uncharacterized protein G2W53_019081 [Senna tora]
MGPPERNKPMEFQKEGEYWKREEGDCWKF